MTDLMAMLSGTLTDEARVWTALAPLLVISAYFIFGLFTFLVLQWRNKVTDDAETLARGETFFLGQTLRQAFIWLIQPLWRLVRATGLPADAVTMLSMLVAVASGLAMAGGRFALGGWLYILSGTLDIIDGRLARASGTQSPAGAALDSVLDRYADSAVLVGMAWYYRDTWVLAVVMVALVGSLLTSYVRARGEGLGVAIRVGVMQRPERVLTLGVTTAFAPIVAVLYEAPGPHPMHWLAAGGLVWLAISTQWTAAQRLLFLLRALRPKPAVPVISASRDGLPRSVVASGLATAADFAVVVALVDMAGLSPWVATALGSVVGAGVSFSLGRWWAFSPSDRRMRAQAGRYTFVSLTSLALNSGGVAVWQLLPVDYRAAWWVTRGLVFTLWNFPLHRDYVFGDDQPNQTVPAGVH